MLRSLSWAMLAAALVGATGTASAQTEAEGPERLQIKPIADARIRYETVDQDALRADALTLRLRAGAEAQLSRFSLLVEGEGTAAPLDDYNAFPFSLPGESQWRPDHAVVADPMNLELNRLQLQYRADGSTVTLGRQRLNLDDQRWVGSVGWRQNEQTFDAVRGETRLGPVNVDLTYAVSQRTIFGTDGGPRSAYEGDFVFVGLSTREGRIQGKLFAYLLDYDEAFFLANSSQTYGVILSTSVPVSGEIEIAIRASYARQFDYGDNPHGYSANYWSVEGGTTLAGFVLSGGWEQLGSDRGRAIQTPMATLHRFNGWADLFLTTPAAGLRDSHVSISRRFEGVELLPGLNAQLTFHQFDSAVGGIDYGAEWDASIGFQFGRLGILAKLADYQAQAFGSDTRRIWLQAEFAF